MYKSFISIENITPKGFLLTYGPYHVNNFMVDTNIDFDRNLKSGNPEWGVAAGRGVSLSTPAGRHGTE